MLLVGKVVRVLRQVNPLSPSIQASPPVAWPHDSRSQEDSDLPVQGPQGGDAVGEGFGGGVGVSEEEVLHLTQRWSELRGRESFHLLALERAVHEVMPSCD